MNNECNRETSLIRNLCKACILGCHLLNPVIEASTINKDLLIATQKCIKNNSFKNTFFNLIGSIVVINSTRMAINTATIKRQIKSDSPQYAKRRVNESL